MPEIYKELEINHIKGSDLFDLSLQTLEKIGGEVKKKNANISPFSGEASAIVSSVWGWGGMEIKINVIESNELSRLNVKGYIAQLGTTPLANKLDDFLKELSILLEQRTGHKLEYKPFAREFLPKMKFDRRDTSMTIIITSLTLFGAIAELLFGRRMDTIFTIPLILAGYWWGRKLLGTKK